LYKKTYRSRNIRGKRLVCRYLQESVALRRHVPHTVPLSLSNLTMMMRRYGKVYVKPDVGSMGIGIMKLEKIDEGYRVTSIAMRTQVTTNMSTLSAIFAYMKKSTSKPLIIQQAVALDQVNNRPYDIRAMVQRKPGGRWTCNGYLVKVGAANKIVTNYYQGGKILTLAMLGKELQLSDVEYRKLAMMLKSKAHQIAKVLSSYKSGMHELGIDFALDQSRHLWVLEVNSNHPQFHPLKMLDRSAYNRMRSFAASYGRYDD